MWFVCCTKSISTVNTVFCFDLFLIYFLFHRKSFDFYPLRSLSRQSLQIFDKAKTLKHVPTSVLKITIKLLFFTRFLELYIFHSSVQFLPGSHEINMIRSRTIKLLNWKKSNLLQKADLDNNSSTEISVSGKGISCYKKLFSWPAHCSHLSLLLNNLIHLRCSLEHIMIFSQFWRHICLIMSITQAGLLLGFYLCLLAFSFNLWMKF